MTRTLITAAAAVASLSLALGALAAEPPPAPAPAPEAKAALTGDLAAAVAGVEARYREVTDFSASFAQQVRRAHLPRPLNKSGKVYYKAPGMMRWDYTQPERVYYVSDGEVLWSYEQTTGQVIKMSVKDSELYDSLKFLFGKGDLAGSFDITAAPRSDDGLVGLVLAPKKSQSNYKSLTLYADPAKSWEIARTELVDPLDNVSVIELSDLSYDTLKREGFAFKPPKGANVQDLTAQGGGKKR
ncbi:MAG: outer membrane lipoprotein carrier protein LolA [Proteobacteria bacterium]|nr:MAG: outer membrane lipoprotein carrier protein LolA [Pseudomonadota bacterium]